MGVLGCFVRIRGWCDAGSGRCRRYANTKSAPNRLDPTLVESEAVVEGAQGHVLSFPTYDYMIYRPYDPRSL